MLRLTAPCITFRTSGSTGTPKRCTHALRDLVGEAREHSESLKGCRRVLSMVPGHHIYGFIWTALLPAQLSALTLDVRRWSSSRIADEVRPGDLLVGVPASWHSLSRSLDRFPAGVLGVTSGEACPPELFRQITQAGIDLVEIYGSSETAGVGMRRDPAEPFQLLSCWERSDSECDILFKKEPSAPEYARFNIPDLLRWEGNRRFQVGARKDGAVQVSGKNVFPERVAEVIRRYPAVEACLVRAMRPREGTRLKAFIVWRSGWSKLECSEAMLKKWLEATLQPYERPATFTFGERLPVNEMSKAADWIA